MVGQTISYNNKARSSDQRGLRERHIIQKRFFFISMELQLNTKFHYMEVTATSKNYKISLRISKITVKRKPFFTSAYTLSGPKKKKKKQNKKKKQKKERKIEWKRERTREQKEKEEEKEERGKQKRRKRDLKSFL